MARKSRKKNSPAVMAEQAITQRTYRVDAYVRLSVEDSGKGTPDSIENQRALVMDYIKSQPDMELHALYCDNGETGVSFERPGFEKLLKDLKNGSADCVVVKDLSRFGRNYIETGNYLERVFPFLGVRFVAVTDHFDTLSPESGKDGYIIPLKNLINHIYVKDISQKTGSALIAKQKNGEFLGTYGAYGYQKDPENRTAIIVDPDTAPVVQNIFLWRSQGISLAGIVRRLTELEIPSPSRYRYEKGILKDKRYSASRWRVRTIKIMLENQVYLGHMVQGRVRESLFAGQRKKTLPREEWTVVKNTHEAIIDNALFHKVQKITLETAEAYKGKQGKFEQAPETENILKGLICCGECGTALTRCKHVRINKQKEPKYHVWYSFGCPNHTAFPNRCPFTGIQEKDVLQAVFMVLQTQISYASDLPQLLSAVAGRPEFHGHGQKCEDKKTCLNQSLSQVLKYKKDLFESYYEGIISESEYLSLWESYDKEAEKLKQQISTLSDEELPESKEMTVFEDYGEHSVLTREMVLALVDKITVTHGREITVALKYRDEFMAVYKALEKRAVSACG
ncbi:MAG: recombinase family protein [Lacrimispora sp.]